ncbi:MAG: PfkB family carbohydrate kinase [Candidatus Methanoplasma sp.]|jgi:sugar/nucleoside kinase (ribokinase family)|nr:PfkB family carbohydrate kinase [Candidatus Methanoplasma sp.]
MSVKSPFLSVYGHVTIDQIISLAEFPKLNESVDVVAKKTSLGGTGTNIAVSAARLGVPTAICAFVGEDFPSDYIEEIAASGLNTEELVKVEGTESSQALVFNNSRLEQKVIFHQGPQGSASKLGVRLTGLAKESEHVHFCTGDPEYYISIMQEIRPFPDSISVDPAQEVYKMWSGGSLNAALDLADNLFCNEFEAKVIANLLGIEDVLDVDKPLVVRTEGSAGSIAKIDGEVVRIPMVKGERFEDATGAGDAYRAGFYAGLYNEYSIQESLILASTVSSFVVEKTGALTNIPSWESVLKRAKPYL